LKQEETRTDKTAQSEDMLIALDLLAKIITIIKPRTIKWERHTIPYTEP
jgi:hypothetical protein